MFSGERQIAILNILKNQPSVSVTELIQQFHVSGETIRKDLVCLEKKNLLTRVHGGAISSSQMDSFVPLSRRVDTDRDKKRGLSETAMQVVHENDVIALDTGSTALELVESLKRHFNRLTVVTNSNEVFQCAAEKESFSPILLGGHYYREEASFYGHIVLNAIENLHFQSAFIIPSTVSLVQGIGVFMHELVDVQKLYIKNSDKTYILADSTKFDKTSSIKLCDFLGKTIITDSGLDPDIAQRYRAQGVDLIN